MTSTQPDPAQLLTSHRHCLAESCYLSLKPLALKIRTSSHPSPPSSLFSDLYKSDAEILKDLKFSSLYKFVVDILLLCCADFHWEREKAIPGTNIIYPPEFRTVLQSLGNESFWKKTSTSFLTETTIYTFSPRFFLGNDWKFSKKNVKRSPNKISQRHPANRTNYS